MNEKKILECKKCVEARKNAKSNENWKVFCSDCAIKKIQREHYTDMPYCWCNPQLKVMPNGNLIIVHNE